jgi:hypothetical protein
MTSGRETAFSSWIGRNLEVVTIRRLKSLLAATLLVFALLAVAAAARRPGRYSCAFKGAKTVASDSLGRTFVLTSGPSYNRMQAYGACLFANGVPRYLVDATGGVVDGKGVQEGLTSVDGVSMSGPFEAVYGYIDSGESKQQEPELFVFDARRGYARRSTGVVRYHGGARVVRDLPNTGAELLPMRRPAPVIDKVVLGVDGTVAWTEVELPFTGASYSGAPAAVFSDDRTGSHTLDAFSATVLPGTLALKGSTLTWRDGQHTHAATLD